MLLDSILNTTGAAVSFKALEILIDSCEEEWKYNIIATHLPNIIKNVNTKNIHRRVKNSPIL